MFISNCRQRLALYTDIVAGWEKSGYNWSSVHRMVKENRHRNLPNRDMVYRPKTAGRVRENEAGNNGRHIHPPHIAHLSLLKCKIRLELDRIGSYLRRSWINQGKL
jgi:hypothetical protein